MSIPWALAIPVIIFVGVIVPLWITFHYITVWVRIKKGGPGTVTLDAEEVAALQKSAQNLEKRLESLETILDAEAPNWRKQ